MREEDERALRAAAAEYRAATAALRLARETLTSAARTARAAGAQQAAILRAIDHTWTREHLRTALGLTRRAQKHGKSSAPEGPSFLRGSDSGPDPG